MFRALDEITFSSSSSTTTSPPRRAALVPTVYAREKTGPFVERPIIPEGATFGLQIWRETSQYRPVILVPTVFAREHPAAVVDRPILPQSGTFESQTWRDHSDDDTQEDRDEGAYDLEEDEEDTSGHDNDIASYLDVKPNLAILVPTVYAREELGVSADRPSLPQVGLVGLQVWRITRASTVLGYQDNTPAVPVNYYDEGDYENDDDVD